MRAGFAVPVVVLAAAAVLTGCGSSTITSSALDTAVGPTFARLYSLQQQDKGLSADRTPDGVAQCVRGPVPTNVSAASTTAPAPTFSGAGDDWSCVVNFPYPDGHIEPIVYDVAMQATGCFVASGPASIVGPQTFTDNGGRTVTNPLFEFDSCLDLH